MPIMVFQQGTRGRSEPSMGTSCTLLVSCPCPGGALGTLVTTAAPFAGGPSGNLSLTMLAASSALIHIRSGGDVHTAGTGLQGGS